MDAQRWRDEQRRVRDAFRKRRQAGADAQGFRARGEIPVLTLTPPDLMNLPIVSERGASGQAIIGVKRLLRRLLGPMALEPQSRFNQAIVTALIEQRDAISKLAARSDSAFAEPAAAHGEIDYLSFEERFRGSEKAVESRQVEYLAFLSDRGEVLDIGCGRGELLSMLQNHGTQARGVDIDEDMVARCRERGLLAECDDAIEFLERHPDETFGAVFLGQLVEQLSTEYLVALLDVLSRKTSKGAVVIIVTINPESLPVLMRWYWLDPTHKRLVHPETLQYFMEKAGFRIKTVQFRNDVLDRDRFPSLELDGLPPAQIASFNEAVDGFNARLFGSLDYFVVGENNA
jgi:SAM-dependent methyltransferase